MEMVEVEGMGWKLCQGTGTSRSSVLRRTFEDPDSQEKGSKLGEGRVEAVPESGLGPGRRRPRFRLQEGAWDEADTVKPQQFQSDPNGGVYRRVMGQRHSVQSSLTWRRTETTVPALDGRSPSSVPKSVPGIRYG